ncbi:hypothetical protein P4H32_32355 [Bacillus cereus]|nr:hypothetical protein [Bacillus cereus]
MVNKLARKIQADLSENGRFYLATILLLGFVLGVILYFNLTGFWAMAVILPACAVIFAGGMGHVLQKNMGGPGDYAALQLQRPELAGIKIHKSTAENELGTTSGEALYRELYSMNQKFQLINAEGYIYIIYEAAAADGVTSKVQLHIPERYLETVNQDELRQLATRLGWDL